MPRSLPEDPPIRSLVIHARRAQMTRRAVLAGAAAGASALALAASAPLTLTGTFTSWEPAAAVDHGLKVLATADAEGLRLHTAGGDRTFLPGMNMGGTTPNFQPGEIDVLTALDYRRWFAQMADMGIRVVRIYTLHPPAFYNELAAWNTDHPNNPLYLFQGVYLPDESYTEADRTLYTPAVDDAFTAELADVSAAVHGKLYRDKAPGRASGTWTTDVSRWVAAWIIGVELDPVATKRTDTSDAGAPYQPGKYFAAKFNATATERWLARHMDDLAAAESAQGVSVPIAFVNWPTTDPLNHPQEPLATEDLVGVDAEHVLPTSAWPGGTFASFHAYPYYPDFLRHEPGLRDTVWNAKADPYAGYIKHLVKHFTSMPLLVTETGVPSSIGMAHNGILGRDQGAHSEADAMAIDASLLHLIHDQGAAGAFVFSWTDEWFKRSWNTQEAQVAGRRQLWHDPLTNEQWFGVLAADSDIVDGSKTQLDVPGGLVRTIHLQADASFVYLDVVGRTDTPADAKITVDTLPGDGPDYQILVNPQSGTAQAFVRANLDPVRLFTDEKANTGNGYWHLFCQVVNRTEVADGVTYPLELADVGNLRQGTWDTASPAYDSRATWHVDSGSRTLSLRIPWPMVGMADPSSRTALGTGVPAERVPVDGLSMTVTVGNQAIPLHWTWPIWNQLGYTERLKHGTGVLAAAFRALG